MHYPQIDPIIYALGPVAIRWYGLAYLLGFGACWWLGNRRGLWPRQDVADLVFYGAMGAVLGGRIGYVVFYAFEQWLADPLYIVRLWSGGMSFHGGLLGTIAALALFARKTDRPLLAVTDFIAPFAPIGLGLGRLGNFANTELPGRATDTIFGLVYPCNADAIRAINPVCFGQWETFARHPSPLYQAFSEGLLLFVVLWWVSRQPRQLGFVSGVFLLAYGVLRLGSEFFREPDAHLGFIALDWVTMGQLISLPMLIAGIVLMRGVRRLSPRENQPKVR